MLLSFSFLPRPGFLALLALTLATPLSLQAQEWRHYGGDAGGTKYSALKQINRENVSQLKPAWTFDTGDFSDGTQYPPRSAFECTPLIVDGVMYVSTPFHRLIALEPDTGKQLWAFDSGFDKQTRLGLFISRGVAYWQEGSRSRVFLGTQAGQLFSIDAKTGKLDPAFAKQGKLDLRKGVTEKFPHLSYGLTSPVAVCGDRIVVGGWVSDGEPQGPSGDIRAFDARSGRQVWRFHTVPRAGEFGNDTWQGESWKDRGGVNAWSTMSVDQENDMVFVPSDFCCLRSLRRGSHGSQPVQ